MFKEYAKLIYLNLVNAPCIYCCGKGFGSTRYHIIFDKKYKKYKYYIKCKCCNTVTPAFEDPKDALDFWDEYAISKEIEILEKENNL